MHIKIIHFILTGKNPMRFKGRIIFGNEFNEILKIKIKGIKDYPY